MKIMGVHRTSLIDYPPYVAATIFTGGCDFRCPYCQNPNLLDEPGEGVIPTGEVLEFLEGRQGLLDGICVTGGEPLMMGDSLCDFLSRVKALDFLVKIDTNGSFPGVLELIIKGGLADYIAMDIKSDKEHYAKACGIQPDMAKIFDSVSLIKTCGIDHEFRTTVVPSLHDAQILDNIIDWVAPSVIYFQQFQNKVVLDDSLKVVKPYSLKDMEGFIGSRLSDRVRLRGF